MEEKKSFIENMVNAKDGSTYHLIWLVIYIVFIIGVFYGVYVIIEDETNFIRVFSNNHPSLTLVLVVLMMLGFFIGTLFWPLPQYLRKRNWAKINAEAGEVVDITDTPYPAKLRIRGCSSNYVLGTVIVILPRGSSDPEIKRLGTDYDDSYQTKNPFVVSFTQGGSRKTWTWRKTCYLNGVPVYVDEIETQIES